MKTRLLPLSVFLVLALPLRAQWSEDLDTLCQARLMVMYELTYREDTNHIDRTKKRADDVAYRRRNQPLPELQ